MIDTIIQILIFASAYGAIALAIGKEPWGMKIIIKIITTVHKIFFPYSDRIKLSNIGHLDRYQKTIQSEEETILELEYLICFLIVITVVITVSIAIFLIIIH